MSEPETGPGNSAQTVRWRKRLRNGCLTLGGIALLGVILIVGFGFSAVMGLYFDVPWDRAKLRRMCDPVKQVPLVLEAHFAKHGSYGYQHYPIAGLDTDN